MRMLINMKTIVFSLVLALVIFISGCGGPVGSVYWSYAAEDYEKRAFYDSLSLSEICSYWDSAWRKGRLRGLVKQSLGRRGVDPYYCYNPELDALNKIQYKLSNR